jgi:aldehyde dehydrogenase (NAD+)
MGNSYSLDEIIESVGLEKSNHGTYQGEWTGSGKEQITSYSPIDGSIIGTVTATTKQEYETVVARAVEANKRWADMPPPARGALIREIGNELRKEKQKLGRLVSVEVGKTRIEGEGEIQEMIDIADLAVGLSRQLYGLEIASERPMHRMYEQWHPLGTISVITSFNFPCSVWSWNAFIAAVTGDTVIWKPSSKATLTAVAVMRVMERVIKRLHYPDIFYLVTGSGGVIGESIASDPRIKLVSFTGSVSTGKHISEVVARHLGKSLLELGGNNAAIVSDKSDLTIALKGVAFGALATAGQRCTSTRRAIVNEKIYDTFVTRLMEIYSKVKVDNPLKEDVLVGPLIDVTAVNKFLSAIKKAQKEGGKLIFGGKKVKIKGLEKGYYVSPAIIEANRSMEIPKEETFAPILYVYKYRNINEAIEIHNEVPQGLSSSIFSNDLREVEEFLSLRGSDCGLANVNTSTAGAEIGGAFGGEKDTGGGRESGSDAWKNYMRRQTVTINYGKDLPLSQGVRFDIQL